MIAVTASSVSSSAGKTNTLFKIIEEIAAPFLVIEPVKGEYRSLLGEYPDTRIWTMRTSDAAMEGVEVLQLNRPPRRIRSCPGKPPLRS